MSYLELLRTQPSFRRLWLGQLVSELGDWLQLIALVGLFPTEGEATLALSGIFIVRLLPSIVWAPLVGVVADRFPRGRVMVACDLGRAVIVLSYLFIRGPEDVVWIYALMFAQESLTALFEPARAAALPQVVPPKALLAANSLSSMTWSSMLAIGSALGGLIAGTIGARAAFIANGVSFLASALLIGGIGIPRVVRDAASAAAHARDTFGLFALREGIAYLRSHRPQAAAALVKGLWGMSGGIVFLFSIYAGAVFSAGGAAPARATGLLYAGRGVGALVGPLVTQRLWGESSRSLRRSIQVGFPLAAVAYVAFSFAPNAVIGALLLVCAHAGGSACWVSSTQLLQISVPNGLQGRVFAVELCALTFTMALSNAFAGVALGRDVMGLRAVTFVIAGAAAVSALIWALTMRRLGRRLDAAAVASNNGTDVGGAGEGSATLGAS
jgi:MFS family permease